MANQHFRTSEQTDKIDAALAKAQAKIRPALRNSVNPHFKSRFADLGAIFDACRSALTEAGVAIIQAPTAEGKAITVTTRLSHAGQFYEADLTVDAPQAGPQGLGSCVSYLKRYGLAAMAGVATGDDDDGEAAEEREQHQAPVPQQHKADPAQVNPPVVMALWARAKKELGDDASKAWDAAAKACLGDPYPPSAKWTLEQAEKVGRHLFDVGY